MAGSGAFQNVQAPALPVIARDPPPEGQMVVPFDAILTHDFYDQTQVYNFGGVNNVSQVRTLFVDNSENPFSLFVTHGLAQLTTLVPPAGGALIPTTSSKGGYSFEIATSNPPASDVPIGIALYNYEIPPSLWGTQVLTVSNTVPIGCIMLWYGTQASIPAGYGICDGTVYSRSDGAGTIQSPNLRDQFIIGAGAGGAYAPGNTGGSTSILQANLPNCAFPVTDPAHNHLIENGTSDAAGGSYWVGAQYPYSLVGRSANATTGITVASGGSGTAFLPPFYALCYIMKF